MRHGRRRRRSGGDLEEIDVFSLMTPVADDAQPTQRDSTTVQAPLTDATTALLATQYGTWYPALRAHTPKSMVLDVEEIQPEFVAWLDEDGLVLSDANDDRGPLRTVPRDEDLEVLSNPSEEEDEEDQGAYFPALNDKIRAVLDRYGAVFPKFNWSAPQDAAWIMPGNTLKCQSPNDIYLLLKSSDFAMKDLLQVRELASACEAQQRSDRPRLQLVLKKWFEMPRSHEFRCFVRDGLLVAACQRDMTFYEHLQAPSTQARIQAMLAQFYTEHISAVAPRDIVFDVYLTRNLDRGFLMDLNPWLPRTDPLLWSYDELASLEPKTPVPLRVLTSAAQASQALPTYSAHMVPSDVVDMSQGQNIAEFAQQWSSQLKEATAAEDD